MNLTPFRSLLFIVEVLLCCDVRKVLSYTETQLLAQRYGVHISVSADGKRTTVSAAGTVLWSGAEDVFRSVEAGIYREYRSLVGEMSLCRPFYGHDFATIDELQRIYDTFDHRKFHKVVALNIPADYYDALSKYHHALVNLPETSPECTPEQDLYKWGVFYHGLQDAYMVFRREPPRFGILPSLQKPTNYTKFFEVKDEWDWRVAAVPTVGLKFNGWEHIVLQQSYPDAKIMEIDRKEYAVRPQPVDVFEFAGARYEPITVKPLEVPLKEPEANVEEFENNELPTVDVLPKAETPIDRTLVRNSKVRHHHHVSDVEPDERLKEFEERIKKMTAPGYMFTEQDVIDMGVGGPWREGIEFASTLNIMQEFRFVGELPIKEGEKATLGQLLEGTSIKYPGQLRKGILAYMTNRLIENKDLFTFSVEGGVLYITRKPGKN